MLCGSLDGRGVWGRMDTCVCMAESLCYPPEAITTLLIGYTLISLVLKKERKNRLSFAPRMRTEIIWSCPHRVYFCIANHPIRGLPGGSVVKNPSAMQVTHVRSLGWEDPLEEEMATHLSILAWRIPWTVESDRPQSIGLQRVRHEWAINIFTSSQLYITYMTPVFWRSSWVWNKDKNAISLPQPWE